jgi:tRNA-Thr(GGU) m(6)t(6)A37 methyltransferase TsaA
MDAGDIRLTVIGVVHSPIKDHAAMPMGGVPATIEISPEFAPALANIATNSHLIILGWFHQAPRDRLQVAGRHAPPGAALRGVFGLRAPSRPNPIGCTVAQLLDINDPVPNRLHLDRLDFIDGTPIVDIKRYSPAIDSVFAAYTSRDAAFPTHDLPDELARAAVNFHGEWCAGVAAGVVLLTEALTTWGIAARHPDLRVQVGHDGCLADALQGMTGATLGTGRLTVCDDPTVRLTFGPHTWAFHPTFAPGVPPDAILAQPLIALGQVETEA